MSKNRFNENKVKPKSNGLTEYEYSLLWAVILGFIGFSCLFYNLYLGAVLLFLAIAAFIDLKRMATTKPSNPKKPDVDSSPIPNKPKPFNPPPFESVREANEVLPNQQARQPERMSMKQYLELSHDDKAKAKPVQQNKPVYPASIPYQVKVMVNGDERIALRLYEGIASRNMGKDETWIWGKVISDLIRDRR